MDGHNICTHIHAARLKAHAPVASKSIYSSVRPRTPSRLLISVQLLVTTIERPCLGRVGSVATYQTRCLAVDQVVLVHARQCGSEPLQRLLVVYKTRLCTRRRGATSLAHPTGAALGEVEAHGEAAACDDNHQ